MTSGTLSQWAYSAFLLLIAAERLFELRLSARNRRWALARGGVEYGAGHFRWMSALHTVFLLACLGESWLVPRTFVPAWGIPAFCLALAAQGLRYWTIVTLGPRWNVRVVVLPGEPVIVEGPFRWLRHPNYVAVVAEGLALPLIHGAWWTALAFSLANAALLRVRIRCEEQALRKHCSFDERFAARSGEGRRREAAREGAAKSAGGR